MWWNIEKIASVIKIYKPKLAIYEAGDATALWKWKDKYHITEDTFYDCMVRAYKATKEPKLLSFQFKILHNVLNNGSNLYKWKIRDSNVCQICKQSVDTIVHEMTGCEATINILNLLSTDSQIENLLRGLTKTEYIFGCNDPAKNHILLILKYVIHISRQHQFPFNRKVLYSEIYKRIIVDRSKLKPTAFNQKWKNFDSLCQNAYVFDSQYKTF